jgi:hypothetical protein
MKHEGSADSDQFFQPMTEDDFGQVVEGSLPFWSEEFAGRLMVAMAHCVQAMRADIPAELVHAFEASGAHWLDGASASPGAIKKLGDQCWEYIGRHRLHNTYSREEAVVLALCFTLDEPPSEQDFDMVFSTFVDCCQIYGLSRSVIQSAPLKPV